MVVYWTTWGLLALILSSWKQVANIFTVGFFVQANSPSYPQCVSSQSSKNTELLFWRCLYLSLIRQCHCFDRQLRGTVQWQVERSECASPPPGHEGIPSSGSSVRLWCNLLAPAETPAASVASVSSVNVISSVNSKHDDRKLTCNRKIKSIKSKMTFIINIHHSINSIFIKIRELFWLYYFLLIKISWQYCQYWCFSCAAIKYKISA